MSIQNIVLESVVKPEIQPILSLLNQDVMQYITVCFDEIKVCHFYITTISLESYLNKNNVNLADLLLTNPC